MEKIKYGYATLRIRILCFLHFFVVVVLRSCQNRRLREIILMRDDVTATMVIDMKITSKSDLYLQIQNTLCKIGKEPVLLACRLSC